MSLVVPPVSGEDLVNVLRLAGYRCVARSRAVARLESDELEIYVPLVREIGADDFRRVLLAARLTASRFVELLASAHHKAAG